MVKARLSQFGIDIGKKGGKKNHSRDRWMKKRPSGRVDNARTLFSRRLNDWFIINSP